MTLATDDQHAAKAARLESYENRTAMAMVVLALVYLGIYSVEVLNPDLPTALVAVLSVVGLAIWITFGVDLAIRAILSPSWRGYLLRHPIDVLAVALPMFRFLRVLRVVTAGQWLIRRGSRLAIGQTAVALGIAVSFLALVGALAVLDAERDAAGATITTFGDAIWWAFVTMSTVGYGDEFPVTFLGRIVAVGMMLVGIGLLGLVSATLASGFLARLQAQEDSEQAELLARLDSLQAEVASLSTLLRSGGSGDAGPRGGALGEDGLGDGPPERRDPSAPD